MAGERWREALGDSVELAADTARLAEAVLDRWPQHAKFLRASLGPRDPVLRDTTEAIASLLIRVAASEGRTLDRFAEDYRYLCEEIVYPEEIFFRREGRYRLRTFADAAREVYDNAPLMSRYMNGLFMSDVLWVNHASAMNDFAKVYLPGRPAGGAHLEIGPGHGMLLHLAVLYGAFESLTAWDVSETSVAHTRHVLTTVGQADRVDLRLQDLYAPEALNENRGRFDTIVLSEVLEHLEQPGPALEIIRDLLAPAGTAWINVPANGPAPDHLFLLRSIDEAVAVIEGAGLSVLRAEGFPVAGASLERALRQELPISCVIVAGKAT